MFSSLFGGGSPETKLSERMRLIATADTGGRWKVELLAAVRQDVVDFYSLLTRPNNASIYRSVEVISYGSPRQQQGTPPAYDTHTLYIFRVVQS